METLFIYLLKSSGLVTLFFLAYYFLYEKTFFTVGFFVGRFVTSAILPYWFSKTVWVEPSPVIDWSQIPVGIPVDLF
jgi:hypothetical protein